MSNCSRRVSPVDGLVVVVAIEVTMLARLGQGLQMGLVRLVECFAQLTKAKLLLQVTSGGIHRAQLRGRVWVCVWVRVCIVAHIPSHCHCSLALAQTVGMVPTVAVTVTVMVRGERGRVCVM